jgi:hypothetical protein
VINIQHKVGTKDTSPSQITKSDMVVVKCHLRYLRNRQKRHHGLNKYLLGVKLLKQISYQIMSRKQMDIFFKYLGILSKD